MNNSTRPLLRKVPEITAVFWVAKILTTAMGEATSDFLAAKFNPYLAVVVGALALVAALALQLSVRRYIPWVYWLTVAMVAVFGTMAADVLHVQFGVPYIISTLCFAVILAAVFMLWQKSERTLSIHSITTRRRETFYWATVLATFALGTAAGDLTATTVGLGYFSSGLLFAGIILIPLIASRFKVNDIFTFWFAYIITRPLGASVADWLGKPHSAGGRAYGDGHVSIILTLLIIVCVGYMTFNRNEQRQENV